METKPAYLSKTMWINGLLGLASFAALFFQAPAADGASWIQAHTAEIGMAWSVLGMALRLISKDKIALGD